MKLRALEQRFQVSALATFKYHVNKHQVPLLLHQLQFPAEELLLHQLPKIDKFCQQFSN